ncbi:MAG: NYN domain-containing protein, partial [Thermodesulfobacteriota bacterium]|nr:NYN domain-containing protein [Thermodesulfobacteriota bacterium]
MADKSICKIGIFYDGSYFAYPQRYFYHKLNLGWLSFKPFHSLIESYIRTKEQGYTDYRIVYASWTQGLFTSSEADERQLRNDRNLQHD